MERLVTAEEFLDEALGGNMNISALKPLAWHEIMTAYAKHYHEAKSDSSAGLEAAVILKGINDEPEYPGEMTDKLWDTLKIAFEHEDKDLLMYVFRQAVKDTKRGIIERLGL